MSKATSAGVILVAILSASCHSSDTRANASTPTTPTPQPAAMFYIASGTVRDDGGMAVAGAQVVIMDSYNAVGFSTTTANDGTFSGRLPGRDGYYISVGKAGFLRLYLFPVAILSDRSFDLTLHPGVEIRGIVAEIGIGPLPGATVEITSGPDAGRSTTAIDQLGLEGSFGLTALPGTFTVRASKSGYDPVEKSVTAFMDARVNFELKSAYGSCLQSVSPVLFDAYSATGGTETVDVNANAGRSWTTTTDSGWIEIVSRVTQIGSGQLRFRIETNPIGATVRRRGAISIRCSASEGQNVWISQLPDCQVQLMPLDVPDPFPPGGGDGRVHVHTGIPYCRWESKTDADWLRTSGINNWNGDLDAFFVVTPNRTGAPRSAHFIVGETALDVRQRN